MKTYLRIGIVTLLLAVTTLLLNGQFSNVSAQSGKTTKCKDPLATSAGVLYCERFTNGYLEFRDSMLPPNKYVTVRGEFEVIIFDSYVRVVHKSQEIVTIPRERLFYFGTVEYQFE